MFDLVSPMANEESLKALRAKIAMLEQQAAALEQANKPGIAQLQMVIRRYDLTVEDVQLALSISNRQRTRGVPKGTKLSPKYRNPGNPSETWAGRGLKPRWLKTLLKQGKKLGELAV